MKKIAVILAVALINLTSYSQVVSENKDYVLVDSIDLTKSEIYDKTKYFIADAWMSANSITQLDNKENGIILIKGSLIHSVRGMALTYHYNFKYTVEFRMRDGKFKMTVKDIYNNTAHATSNGFSNKPTFTPGTLFLSYNTLDNCPGVFKTNLLKDLVIECMRSLDIKFETLMQSYKIALNNNNLNFNDDF
tara:strand:+ start:41 stop:613 length:573 start_codon:yes stop_codon:yes gene_type:complete